MFSPERLRAFVRTPLWLGLPVAAIVAFAVIWAICASSPAVDNPFKSATVSAVCVAIGWVLGIWASVTPDNEKDDEKDDDMNADTVDDVPILRARLTVAVLLLGFLAIISIPDICRVVEDGRPVAIGIAGFMTKLLGIAAVAIPVWLRLRCR